mgnify:CR=1 FL=1
MLALDLCITKFIFDFFADSFVLIVSMRHENAVAFRQQFMQSLNAFGERAFIKLQTSAYSFRLDIQIAVVYLAVHTSSFQNPQNPTKQFMLLAIRSNMIVGVINHGGNSQQPKTNSPALSLRQSACTDMFYRF